MNLKELNNDIWVFHPRRSRTGYAYSIEKDDRFITPEEWEQIKAEIKEQKLLVTPGSGVFGFSFSLTVWKTTTASYPGTEEAFPPEALLSITAKHMEKVMDQNRGPELSERFWYEIIVPLAYSEENVAGLKKNGFEDLREKSYYDY